MNPLSLILRIAAIIGKLRCGISHETVVDMVVVLLLRGFAAFVSYFVNHPLYTPASEYQTSVL